MTTRGKRSGRRTSRKGADVSRRRKPGDWVKLPPNTGFVGESDRLPAEIQDQGSDPCMRDCGDPDCQEWATLWTAPYPAPGGVARGVLCHVSECEMEDAT